MRVRILALMTLALSLSAPVRAGVGHWPSMPLGGEERFLYNEQTFTDARSRIDSLEWARKLYENLRTRVHEGDEDGAFRITPIITEACWAEDAAIYYRISGDESVLPRIKELLVHYYRLDNLEKPIFNPDPKHSTTNYWLRIMQYDCRYLLAYDLVKTHPSIRPITPAFEKRMDEAIVEGYLYDSRIGRIGNTHFFGVTGLGLFGFMRGDKDAVDCAINGPHGFKALLAQFRDDGRFWPEPKAYSYGYVDCCILMLAEAALFNGYPEDLYAYEDPHNGASIRKMIRAFVESCTADGYSVSNGESSEYVVVDGKVADVERPPIFTKNTHRENTKLPVYYARLNDPVVGWAMGKFPENDEYCVQFFGNSALLYGADVTSVEVPSSESVVWQEMGDALLRSDETPSYWDGGAITVHLRGGASQQYHGNNDHMSLVLNSYGRNFFSNWFYAWDYLCPRRGRPNKTPLSQRIVDHNTVVVDMKEPELSNIHLSKVDPERKGAEFSEVRRSGEMKIVSMSGSFYSGVSQKRTVGVTSRYVVDIFEMTSNVPHNYDYILHSNADLFLSCAPGEDVTDKINSEYGFGPVDVSSKRDFNVWISEALSRTESGDVKAVFIDSDGCGVVTFLMGERKTGIINAKTPLYVSPVGLDATPSWSLEMKRSMFVARRFCSSTVFVVVHIPFEGQCPDFAVKRKGSVIHIHGAGFHDRFDISDMTFESRL